MLIVNCSGTPWEIGFEHGQKAATQIKNSLEFYVGLFKKVTNLDWPEIRETAMQFVPLLEERYPWLEEEMRAIAVGAGVDYADVLALNLRLEIMFGLFHDGCTSLAWKMPDGRSILAQNWDWMIEQKPNVIILNVHQPGKPSFSIGTEAGIIGKIGLNSAGVGICANGIRVHGVDNNRTPLHICMRLILESTSKDAAVAAVEKYGGAVSGHLLVADRTGAVGLELTSNSVVKIPMDVEGRIFHSNHLLVPHPGVEEGADTVWVKDSIPRVKRIKELADKLGKEPTEAQISDIFKDVENFPHAICRQQHGTSDSETLFNIVMDLTAGTAVLKLGRPVDPDEIITLNP